MTRSESLTVDVEAGVRIAKAMARRFVGRWVPIDELVSEALVAVADALNRFDPARGVPFAGYVAMCIRHRLIAVVTQWKRRHHLAAVGQGGRQERDIHGNQLGDPFDRVDPRAADPGDVAAGRELWETIRPWMTDAQFEVLHARVHGQTQREIARGRNRSRQDIAQIEERALTRARKALGTAAIDRLRRAIGTHTPPPATH